MIHGHRCHLRHHSGTHLAPVLPGTSKWVKLCRFVRCQLLADQDHPETKNYLKSNAQICNENRRQVSSYPPYVIHPFSRFRKHWDLVMFVTLALHMLLLAYDFTFLIFRKESSYHGAIVFDLFLCAVLTVEICLKFITGYVVTDTNEIVLEPHRIAFNYMKSYRLVYDLLAVLPYIILLNYFNHGYYQYRVTAYLVFVTYLYVVNIFRFREIFAYFQTLPRIFQVSQKKILIMKVVMNTVYVLHWSSCLRYILPELSAVLEPNSEDVLSLGNPLFRTDNFSVGRFIVDVHWRHYRNQNFRDYPVDGERIIINPPEYSEYLRFYYFNRPADERLYDRDFVLWKLDNVRKNSTIANRYLASFMATLKLSLQAGRDDSVGLHFVNTVLSTFLLVGGWIWFTYIMLIMVRTIFSSEVCQTRFEELVNEIKAYALNKRLSGFLERKLLRHLDFRYRKNYFDEKAIVRMMPDNFRKNLRMEIRRKFLKNVELFEDLPESLIEDIVDSLKYEIYLENDVITEAGTIGDALYLLASGTVAVYSREGTELGHLFDGAHFGEISLLQPDHQRTATIIALENCEVYRLSHESFQQLIEPHSPLLLKMHKLAEKKLAKEMRNGENLSEEELYDNFLQ
ncbi:potassium voltage-gated channel subfamily H member 1-like [Sabethes cyaneus]|uniref:potassium voltage-gated channel subfamily H member 1-like n=1 Tax=Sabethes cyaneus TaxID=53552 RepID=UPI00237E82F2|nr:potassium voltage-gated channel subfamily H member 1-like [Sabethes cyaneus]